MLVSYTVGTFSVINVIAKTSELECVYNPGSPAKGCVVYLKNYASDVTYCKVLAKSENVPVNPSLCNSSYSNGPLNVGIYYVKAHDIGNDGKISELPAVDGLPFNLSTPLKGLPVK